LLALGVGVIVALKIDGSRRCARAGGLTLIAALAICGVFAGTALATLSSTPSPSPVITGTPQVGQPLTLTPGVWTGVTVTQTEQWKSCVDPSNPATCTNVGNLNDTTYTPVDLDHGNTIVVLETATDTSDSSTNTATADASGLVKYAAPTLTLGSTPTITGGTNPPRQAQILSASTGSWTNQAQDTFTYQWQQCDSGGGSCSSSGTNSAANTSYTLGTGDIGKTVRVVVTASNDGGTGPVGTSPATAVVIPLAPVIQTPGPAILGTFQQGSTLLVSVGSWSNVPTSYAVQWSSCDTTNNCLTATGLTYPLTFADVGHKITVAVKATNAGGTGGPAPSAAYGPVTPLAPVNQSAPLILGSVAQGQTLSVVHGAWANGPTSFADQWERCDGAGTSCAAIPGATGQTYVVGGAEVGHTLRVSELASNITGASSAPGISLPTPAVTVQASFTSLLSVPSTLVTNQDVTLIATVTSSSGVSFPSGTVTFENRGVAIGGCAKESVQPTDQSVTVTCQASFAASTSPEQLTAVFTPSAGASVGGSTGPAGSPYRIVVSKDSTSTGVQVSNPTVNVGGSATYTATVTPTHPGSARPAGSVEFLDGGKPISGCTARALVSAGGFSTATCKVSYGRSGAHSVTARYGGDTSFSSSGDSPAQQVNVHTQPARCCVTTAMQWTFFYAPSYTKVLVFAFTQVPVGGSVLVACHGHGCPFARTSVVVRKAKACRRTAKHRCTPQQPAAFNLAGRFRFRHLALGTRITVQIVLGGWVGKYYSFTVQRHRTPSVKIACLAPGSSQPGLGC
jgi:hypothetical protein